MKPTLRFLPVVILALCINVAGAQSWTHITAIKEHSLLRNIYMPSPSTGYALDVEENRFLRTRDGGMTWSVAGSSSAASATSLWMFNDSVGIVGTGIGEFYRTTNGFATRTTITTNTGSTKALYFVDNNAGYAIANDINIKKTSDGGLSWTLQPTGNTNGLRGLFFVDVNTGYACGVSGTILKTVNGGSNWTPVSSGYSGPLNDICFVNNTIGVACGTGTMLRTVDGGASWSPVSISTTQTLNKLYQYNGTLYATGAGGVLLRSLNGGLSWVSTTLGSFNHYSIHINAMGAGLLGGDGTVYRTADGGVTWTRVQSGPASTNLNSISFANDQVGVAAGSQETGSRWNAVLRTTDGGRTWTSRQPGASTYDVQLNADGTGIVAGSSGYNETTANFGQSFTQGLTRPAAAAKAAWYQGAGTWILGSFGPLNTGLYRTTNGGSSWTYTAGISVNDIYFLSAQVGYAAGNSGGVMKTTTGGSSWTDISLPFTANFNRVYFRDDNNGFLLSDGALFRTTDGGINWTTQFIGNVKAMRFFSADSGYAVTGTGLVMKTLNGGASWTNVVSVNSIPVNHAAILQNGVIVTAAGNSDIYRTSLTCADAVSAPVVINGNGTLYSSYAAGNQWYGPGGLITGATDSAFSPLLPGDYYVVHRNAQGCASAASNTVTVLVSSVSAVNAAGGIRVFPNPTDGPVRLELPAHLRRQMVVVRNSTGQLVYSKNAGNTAVVTVDLSAHPSGVYFITVGRNLVKVFRR